MKRFLVKISVFLFITAITGIALDLSVSSMLRKDKTSRLLATWSNIVDGSAGSDVLIMGSSRAWVQYSPKILESVCGGTFYNLGIDGSQIDRQIYRYDIYRCYNRKPKMIIQNIDILTLRKTNGYEREQFFPYWYDRNFFPVIRNENFSWAEKIIPVYRYFGYGGLVKCSVGLPNKYGWFSKDAYKGYCGNSSEWDGSELAKITRMNINYDEDMLNMFEEYVKQVKAENIKMVFVYAPFYIGAIQKVVDLDKCYSAFADIAKKYDVPILDYTYSPISYDTKYFYNAGHLDKDGSEIFSAQLAKDLVKLNLFEKE